MRIKKLFQRAMIAGALGVSLCAALPAQAGVLNGSGFANGSQTFDLSKGGTAEDGIPTGGFVGTWNGDPLQFWCAELSQSFSFHVNYDYTASIPNNATFTRLGELFHEAYGTGVGQALHDAEHSAAFQLAIWEILFDGTNLNLSSGTFKVTNAHGNTAAVADAQGWLANLGSVDDYNITFLSNDAHQDFITGTPPRDCCKQEVPEPAPLALVAVGLLAMIVAARRRTSKATTA